MIEIITIGDELLIGQIVDTNSAWMSAELNKAGFEVSRITSIHDDENQIVDALNNALSAVDVVLITGGLGPTKDDITKHALSRYFGTRLIHDEAVYRNIERLFKHRPSVMNELTKLQAMVPENCTVIQNSVGTAPIMWFERAGKVVVSMPGVPFEMKKVMSEEIIPRLSGTFRPKSIVHQTVQVYGYGESALALKIADWENQLPDFLHLAYLPNLGVVRLRLSGTANDRAMLEKEVKHQLEKLGEILGDNIVASNDLPIEYTLFEQLKAKNFTLSTAESCTGGNIARRLTRIPGISDVFKGGVVVYTNELKMSLLGVGKADLEQSGAVSRRVVEQMAARMRQQADSDFSIAVSGIAGPTGGTDEKPVGTVWMAVADADGVSSRKFQFGDFPRDIIIERASTAALMMVLEKVVLV